MASKAAFPLAAAALVVLGAIAVLAPKKKPAVCPADGPRWRVAARSKIEPFIAPDHLGETFRLDFNHDGRVDLLLSVLNQTDERDPARPLRLLENRGDGTFADVTAEKLGRVLAVHARHLAEGDFDGDGVTDFLIADHGFDRPPFPGRAPLLLMSRGGRLADESALRLPPLSDFTFHAVALDADGDGDVDIYLSNFQGPRGPPRILWNDGRGFFRAQAVEIRRSAKGKPVCQMAAAAADFDGDGRAELYGGGCDIAGPRPDNARDSIFDLRSGAPSLWPAGTLPLRRRNSTWGTVAVTAEDLDGDGRADAAVAVHDFGFHTGSLQIFRNAGDRSFTEVRVPFEPETSVKSFVPWIEAGDVDGDGRKDLLFSVRSVDTKPVDRPLRLLRRKAGPEYGYDDLTPCLPPKMQQPWVRAHLIDTDGDGRFEIVLIFASGDLVTVSTH